MHPPAPSSELSNSKKTQSRFERIADTETVRVRIEERLFVSHTNYSTAEGNECDRFVYGVCMALVERSYVGCSILVLQRRWLASCFDHLKHNTVLSQIITVLCCMHGAWFVCTRSVYAALLQPQLYVSVGYIQLIVGATTIINALLSVYSIAKQLRYFLYVVRLDEV